MNRRKQMDFTEGWEPVGAYRACLEAPFRTEEMRRSLAELAAGRDADWVRRGRLFTFQAAGKPGARGHHFLIQAFPATGGFVPSGSPACGGGAQAVRAVESARRLLGRAVQSPEPIACLVRPDGLRHWEGLAVFQMHANLCPLQEWLAHLLEEQNDFGCVREWVRAVGAAIHDLHEAGVFHGNLDRWNVWVDTRRAPCGGICFTGLERCVIGAAPRPWERLRDWAALDLPPRLLAEARAAVPGDAPSLWVMRGLRAQRRAIGAVRRLCGVPLPPPVDTTAAFLWDAAREEAVDLERKDATPVTPLIGWMPVRLGVSWGGDDAAFAEPVTLPHRLAVGVHAGSEPQALAALGEPGIRDVWVRLCCHDADEQRAAALASVQNWLKEGYCVSVLLVQDRRAVQDPERWVTFVMRALEPVGWQVRRAVYGFAPDEAAWGFRSAAEYRRFLEPLQKVRDVFPGVVFSGPACAVGNARFLSHTTHALARVGGWESCVCRTRAAWLESAAVSDAAWLKQLARFCRAARGGAKVQTRPILIVEPADDGGENRTGDAEACELRLARYMRRTILAVCSGLIEQVVLMQPAHSGDLPQQAAQQEAWRVFMRRVGAGGQFVRREPVAGGGLAWLLRFEDSAGRPVWMGWNEGGPQIVTAAVVAARACDLLGRTAPLLPAPRLRLIDLPIYFE
jgi:hypothetical protein